MVLSASESCVRSIPFQDLRHSSNPFWRALKPASSGNWGRRNRVKGERDAGPPPQRTSKSLWQEVRHESSTTSRVNQLADRPQVCQVLLTDLHTKRTHTRSDVTAASF